MLSAVLTVGIFAIVACFDLLTILRVAFPDYPSGGIRDADVYWPERRLRAYRESLRKRRDIRL